MTESLSWALERATLVAPRHTAVIDGDTVFDYTELARRVAGLGGGLQSLGVDKGDVVGVMAMNSHRHLEYWLGVPAIGAILNDLNYRLGEDEMAFIIDDCSTKVLAVDDVHLELGERLRSRCPSLRTLVHLGPGATPEGMPNHEDLVAGPPATPVQVAPEASRTRPASP